MTVADLTLGEFLDGVASRAVTPSGGAVAAVGGAGGAALCEMACLHTLEATDSTPDERADLPAVRDALADLRGRLLGLADEDARAVQDLQEAIGTAETLDADAVQEAAERATEVPLRTAQACCEVVEYATVVTGAATPRTVPDAGTGALLAHASLTAAVWTTRSNLATFEDAAFVADARDRADALGSAAGTALEDVEANVRDTW